MNILKELILSTFDYHFAEVAPFSKYFEGAELQQRLMNPRRSLSSEKKLELFSLETIYLTALNVLARFQKSLSNSSSVTDNGPFGVDAF